MEKKHHNFAARLTELREEAGLSQYALAQKSGVSKQALSRLEKGELERSEVDTVAARRPHGAQIPRRSCSQLSTARVGGG